MEGITRAGHVYTPGNRSIGSSAAQVGAQNEKRKRAARFLNLHPFFRVDFTRLFYSSTGRNDAQASMRSCGTCQYLAVVYSLEALPGPSASAGQGHSDWLIMQCAGDTLLVEFEC